MPLSTLNGMKFDENVQPNSSFIWLTIVCVDRTQIFTGNFIVYMTHGYHTVPQLKGVMCTLLCIRDVSFSAFAGILSIMKSKFLHFDIFSACFWGSVAQIHVLFQAFSLRGYCTPGQFLECFCIFLKNYNT